MRKYGIFFFFLVAINTFSGVKGGEGKGTRWRRGTGSNGLAEKGSLFLLKKLKKK